MNRKLLDPTLTAAVFFLAGWLVLTALTLATLTPLGSEALGARGAEVGLPAGPGPHASQRW